jgi:hypothetical protein
MLLSILNIARKKQEKIKSKPLKNKNQAVKPVFPAGNLTGDDLSRINKKYTP